MNRKGIILAGGTGSRLYPLTLGISKQLVPVYNKPMIYYPLAVLMLAGIRDIAIITTPDQQSGFQELLGNGSQWGTRFEYISQPSPDGLAQAYLLAEDFLDGASSLLVLGDNIFYGNGIPRMLQAADTKPVGATVFGYQVTDPERYGVVSFSASGDVQSIEEKPVNPASNHALTGLYFCDATAPEKARRVRPSKRGELEIISVLDQYLEEGQLTVELMGRGFAWFDTSTHESLLDAGNFVRTLEKRQGLQIGCPEEISYNNGWIDRQALFALADRMDKSSYGQYLRTVVPNPGGFPPADVDEIGK